MARRYVGNAFYNQYNTLALGAAGGKYGGLTMTVSTMQLGVCSLYAVVLWLIGLNPIKLCGLQLPEKMPFPKTTGKDIFKTIPVGFCSAAAHSAGVFCLGADPLFGQIVKAGEPVLSALVNTVFYGKPPSKAKFVCLFFIVAGVACAAPPPPLRFPPLGPRPLTRPRVRRAGSRRSRRAPTARTRSSLTSAR